MRTAVFVLYPQSFGQWMLITHIDAMNRRGSVDHFKGDVIGLTDLCYWKAFGKHHRIRPSCAAHHNVPEHNGFTAGERHNEEKGKKCFAQHKEVHPDYGILLKRSRRICPSAVVSGCSLSSFAALHPVNCRYAVACQRVAEILGVSAVMAGLNMQLSYGGFASFPEVDDCLGVEIRAIH